MTSKGSVKGCRKNMLRKEKKNLASDNYLPPYRRRGMKAATPTDHIVPIHKVSTNLPQSLQTFLYPIDRQSGAIHCKPLHSWPHLKLPSCSVDDFRFAPYSAAGADLTALKVARSDSNQVTGHACLLNKVVSGKSIVQCLDVCLQSGHEHTKGRNNSCRVGQFVARRILARDKGSSMDLFRTLSECSYRCIIVKTLLPAGIERRDKGAFCRRFV